MVNKSIRLPNLGPEKAHVKKFKELLRDMELKRRSIKSQLQKGRQELERTKGMLISGRNQYEVNLTLSLVMLAT